MRRCKIDRVTNESEVSLDLNIDGQGNSCISTGIAFLDHIITTMAKHAKLDLTLNAKSRDGIMHHLIEDIAITLGSAIDKALNDRKGIARFGYAMIPMDDSLAIAALDLVKRSYFKISLNIDRNEIEGITKEDLLHFLESFLKNLNCCTHLILEYGINDHHKIEAIIKAFAVAFRSASRIEGSDIPSTKGVM